MNYKWAQTYEALKTLRAEDASPYDDLVLEYINPHTGQVTGSRNRQEAFVVKVHQFHTKLLLGPPGEKAVGYGTLSLLLLTRLVDNSVDKFQAAEALFRTRLAGDSPEPSAVGVDCKRLRR